MNKWNRFPLLHNKKASNFYGNNFPSYIPREKLCWSHLSLKYTRFEMNIANKVFIGMNMKNRENQSNNKH